MARLLPWAVVAAVLSAVTANVLRLRGDVSLAGPSVAAQALEIAAGAALIVVGGAAGRGRERWLLSAAGAAWIVAEWASPAGPDATAFTAGLIAVMLPLPLVLASRWRSPLATPGLAPLVLGLLALAILLALAAALLSGPLAAAAASPRDTGCTDCPRDLIALGHDVPLNSLLTRISSLTAIAAGLMAIARLVASTVASRRRAWTHLSPELAADIAATGFVVAIAAGARVALLGGAADPSTYRWHAAAGLALAVLTAAVAVPALRAAQARRVVARTAVAVADDPGLSAVDVLVAALGDDALRIAYPTQDGTWRDHHGQLVILPEQDVTLVTDAGDNVAALLHGSGARIDPALETGAVSAARLLLDIERIEAGAMARARDLRAARRLSVEAADAARASLERDLHDSAQQRMVALRYALGLASARAERQSEAVVAARLDAADLAAEQAIADLRELAHGIGAATLAVDGLAEAVRTAVEHAHTAVTIVELPTGRLPERVERAVYRFVSDALRESSRVPEPGLSIAIRCSGADVVIELECERAAGECLSGILADRVDAADGQLQEADVQARRRLVAVLPCE